jgi:hypothetical protein
MNAGAPRGLQLFLPFGAGPGYGIIRTRERAMKRLLKFYKYAFAWENYLLLARAISAARAVRSVLGDATPTPQLSSSLGAVERLYLPRQPGWRIADAETIVYFARFIVTVPNAWGRCVQQSLIAYRLLNAYGIPARICFGIRRDDPGGDGHAWLVRLSEPDRAFAEASDPRDRFQIVYTSPQP